MPIKGLVFGAFLAGALAAGSCAPKIGPQERFARKYKAAMVQWNEGVVRQSSTFDARIAPIPKAQRRAFLATELQNEAELHESAVAGLDGLGPPPAPAKGLFVASHEMLEFLAHSAREKQSAIEAKDKAALDRIDAEFEREIPRLQARLVQERNLVARNAGLKEMTEQEIVAAP